MKSKKCKRCNELKTLDNFYITNKIYLMSECKECFNERANKFRKDNLEHYRKVKRKYVLKNPKKWTTYSKKWQQQNLERLSKNTLICDYKKKLKNKYDINFIVERRVRTLQELIELCKQIKELYQKRRKENHAKQNVREADK